MAKPLCCLALDVGNTTTRFALFASDATASDEPLGTWELTTPETITPDEARMHIAQVLGVLAQDVARARELSPERAASFARPPLGAILSCVVPTLSDAWASALATACQTRPFTVGPGLKTGLKMRYNDPSELGSDRISDAIALRERYGAPAVAIDLGTTLNIEVLDDEGAFAGGIIAPGLALGARAMAGAAARLPQIELRAPASVVGRSTREAIQSGVVLGEAARVDGLLSRVERECGYVSPVVLTGTGAADLAALLEHDAHVDDTLTLRGLHQLYLLNVGRNKR